MKRKELNLLPEHALFDINKFLLLKKIILIFIFNIILLALITLNLFLQNNFLKKRIKNENRKVNNFANLIEKFVPYETEYLKLKKRFSELESKRKLYLTSGNFQYSPFLSIIILGKNLTDNIKISSLEYSKGSFLLKGKTDSTDSFYKFYDTLNSNKFIRKIDFNYLRGNDNSKFLNFKLAVFLEDLK